MRNYFYRYGWDEQPDGSPPEDDEFWRCTCCGDYYNIWNHKEKEVCNQCEAVEITVKANQELVNSMVARYIRESLSIAEFDELAQTLLCRVGQ